MEQIKKKTIMSVKSLSKITFFIEFVIIKTI